ncbi:hypothetical protein E2C01_000356 [Portunus trituberculatus]|uniref:Uncharacterized protein n=1 Tax=Portunus trituberculatus TaxID=210409 RepID=A0A5B7CE41_PORTR|nr:hypothetical protein [Portunus trituberculatus]
MCGRGRQFAGIGSGLIGRRDVWQAGLVDCCHKLLVVDIHAWTTCPSWRLRNGAACRPGHLGDSHYRRGLPPYPATATAIAWTHAAGTDKARQVFHLSGLGLVLSIGRRSKDIKQNLFK